MTKDWGWYYSRHEEGPYSGPYGSRDEAVTEGRGDLCDGDAFFVVQASNPPVRLAEWIDADRALERADESIFENDRASSEYDEHVFKATADQEADLIARLKRACDEWQEAHGLTFYVNTFADMTAPEVIPEVTEESEDAE